jgi:hypothetical protein
MSHKINPAVGPLAMLPVMATPAPLPTQSPMKKSLTLALAFVTLALIGTELEAQTRTINLNTGYDQWSKAKIDVGQQDNEWRVISDTINGAPQPPLATGRPADVVDEKMWLSPILPNSFPDSRWISINPNYGSPLGTPPNKFQYAFYFTLPAGFSSPVLTMKLSADDRVTKVTLNSGTPNGATLFQDLGGRFDEPPLVLATSALTASNFNSGATVNVIIVEVEDTAALVTGLIVEGAVTYKDCDRLPIRDMPGLTSITFWESTFASPTQHTFKVGGPELTAKLSGPLTTGNSDFESLPGSESYDLFYSTWDGTFAANGQFVTIEADVPGISAPSGGGLNIARVDFNGTAQFADSVPSFVALGNNAMPNDVGKAVDLDPNILTDTTMGNTIGQTQRLRVTVGVDSCRTPGRGTVIVRKNALGDDSRFFYATDGPGLNPFSITTSGGTGTQTFSNIAPGPKTVREVSGPSFVFTNLVCSDPDGGTTISGPTANIDLDPDETVTCTYTNCATIRIEPFTLGNQPGSVNVAYQPLNLIATGGTAPNRFTVSGGTLPPEMVVDTDGTLHGTPVTPGTYDFTVTVTDANGCTGVRKYRLPILCPPITLNPAAGALPAPVNDAHYSQTFTATDGCTSSFTYSVTNGTLPNGLTLSANGVLSGTATQPGDFTFTVMATDSCGCSHSQTYTLKVDCRTVPLPLFNTGVADNGSLLSSGATDSHYVLLNTSPVSPNASVLFPIQIGGYVANSATSEWLGPNLNPLGVIMSPDGFYTYRTTFNLSCDPSTAAISGAWSTDNEAEIFLNGSPTGVTTGPGDFRAFRPFVLTSGFISGVNTLDFRVRNRLSSGGSRTQTGLRVEMNGTVKCCSSCAAITLNPAAGALPAPAINIPYSQIFEATGGCSSSFTYSVTSGALPDGLTLSVDGVLSGAATQAGGYDFTVTATDTCGCSQSENYRLTPSVRRRDFPFRRGMNEYCIWSGAGGGYNSQTPIDNPYAGTVNNVFRPSNTRGVRFGALGLCYGRILWANDRFAFKYTFNAIPVAVLSYPDINRDLGIPVPGSATRRNVFGAGLSPVGFQLYFRPQSRVKPFVSTSGGFLFFNDPVPRLNGARFNFTYDFGGGVQVFRNSRRAFNFGYKYQRITNGGRALNNPGFDGHVFYFGYSIFKAQDIAHR